MNKVIYAILIAIGSLGVSNAQSLSQVVIANAGVTLSGGSNTLSFTAGEAVIGNITNGESLGQGFWLGAIEEVVLSNEDFTFEVNVAAYPNPVTNYLHLSFKDMVGENFKISVYDLNGKQMFHKELENSSATETLNFSAYSTGTYFLNIKQNSTEKTKTIKIIKN